jgi:hypothetical protein
MAEDPKNAGLLQDALYEVTGRRLALAFAEGEDGQEDEEEQPGSEEDLLALMRDTFDATDVDEEETR